MNSKSKGSSPLNVPSKLATRIDKSTKLTSVYGLKMSILLVCSLTLTRYFNLTIKADICGGGVAEKKRKKATCM